MTDTELIKLNDALKSLGMNNRALRAVSVPAANLAAWLWAVLRYGLAQRRGLPTGLLLRQVDEILTREQARLGHYQLQAQEKLEDILTLTKKVQEAYVTYNHMLGALAIAQRGHYKKWPVKPALITPMHTWTTELQVSGLLLAISVLVHFYPHPVLTVPLPHSPHCTVLHFLGLPSLTRPSSCLLSLAYTLPLFPSHQNLSGHSMTVFGDALVCSAAIVYLGPFPPPRRLELLDKWLALCRGFQEPLGPDDVAQALKQKQKPIIMPPKNPLLPTRFPFSVLSLLSCSSEQHQWDRDLKPQVKSARLAGLLLRSCTHYHSCRWPLLLDPSNQALNWLSPLPLEENRLLMSAPTDGRGKAGVITILHVSEPPWSS